MSTWQVQGTVQMWRDISPGLRDGTALREMSSYSGVGVIFTNNYDIGQKVIKIESDMYFLKGRLFWAKWIKVTFEWTYKFAITPPVEETHVRIKVE